MGASDFLWGIIMRVFVTITLVTFFGLSFTQAETNAEKTSHTADVGEQFVVVSGDLQEKHEATARQMAGIWYSIKTTSDEAGRAAVIKYVAQRYWFRAAQVEALLEVILDGQLRANLLVTLYPRLTNPGEFNRLLQKLVPGSAAQSKVLESVGIVQTAAL